MRTRLRALLPAEARSGPRATGSPTHWALARVRLTAGRGERDRAAGVRVVARALKGAAAEKRARSRALAQPRGPRATLALRHGPSCGASPGGGGIPSWGEEKKAASRARARAREKGTRAQVGAEGQVGRVHSMGGTIYLRRRPFLFPPYLGRRHAHPDERPHGVDPLAELLVLVVAGDLEREEKREEREEKNGGARRPALPLAGSDLTPSWSPLQPHRPAGRGRWSSGL